MRKALLLVAALLLASPAVAADKDKGGTSFGYANCGQPFSCAAYTGLMSSDPKILALVSQANACITRYFGQRGDGNSFYEERGLDSSNCLSTKPVAKASVGATTNPRCCIVPASGDSCVLNCELVGTR
jgi:hypothetical protein